MEYIKTNWVDNVTPLSAANFNNLETQYDKAMAKMGNLDARSLIIFAGGLPHLIPGDGDKIITTDTVLPRKLLVYNNLTINSGVNFYAPDAPGINIIVIKERLTLNGNIHANGKGGAGAPPATTSINAGGAGGGLLLIYAKEIVGSGSIMANGDNGVAPVQGYTSKNYNGIKGTAGLIFGFANDAGNGGRNDQVAGGNGGTSSNSLSTTLRPDIIGMITSYLKIATDTGGGGGGSGAVASNIFYPNGGGGGAGVVGGGGNGAAVGGYGSGAGGGGGGGGGMVFLVSMKAVPAITVQAKGGNGANGYSDGGLGGGGGGGGGGFVQICAPSSEAIVSAAGGAAGNTLGGTPAIQAQAGGAGATLFTSS